MLRVTIRGLAVAAVAAWSLGPAPAAAVTPVDSCRALNKAGETYVLTGEISATSDPCFFVDADRITLDLNGHTITGPGGVGIWDGGASRTSTVVKSGSIGNFNEGIRLDQSTRTTVRAVNASDNRASGIIVGPNSLVKDCIVQRNLLGGITIGDRGQVEGCLIGGTDDNDNGGFGILGGQRMLVTRNTGSFNDASGIQVGPDSTVTHNTVNDNGLNGIAAGPGSLVSHNTANHNGNDGIAVSQGTFVSSNTANDNGGDGFDVACPSTVTYNAASGNGWAFDGSQFLIIGPGCVQKGNTSSP